MLLQKTSSRIKQFINLHRESSYGDSSQTNQDDSLTEKSSSTTISRRKSWMSQSLPIAPILHKFNEGASLRRLPSVQKFVTARSSLSSLCSCCDLSATSSHSLFEQEPVPVASDAFDQDQEPSSFTSKDAAHTWRLIFPEQLNLSTPQPSLELEARKSSFKESMSGSTFDLIEALGMDPADAESTPRQSMSSAGSIKTRRFSDNVEHLIRETDEAFRAVGDGLTEMQLPVFGWYGPPAPKPTKRAVIAARNPAKKRQAPFSSNPLKAPFTRSVTVPKVKRKTTFTKPAALTRVVKQVPPPPVNIPSRWTFTDVTATMTDALNGKVFWTEIDEPAGPEPTQQYQEKLDVECEGTPSQGSSRRGSDPEGSTPTEPFHLEYLSARLKFAAKDSDTRSSPGLVPSAFPKDDPIPSPSTTTRPNTVQFADSPVNSPDYSDKMVFRDLNFPSPPRTSSRSWSNQPQSPANFLPAIPEVSPLTNILPRISDRRNTRRQVASLPISPSSSACVFLRATAYTKTSPLYRHGMIRVERRSRGKKGDVSKTGIGSEDEQLVDQTASLRTTSGTAIEDVNRRRRVSERFDTDEVDLKDLAEWWDSMGCGFVGRLDYGKEEPTAPETSYLDPHCRKMDTPEERSHQKSCQDLQRRLRAYQPAAPLPPVSKERKQRKPSTDSTPPSPMLDIKVGIGYDGTDIVPMGFNLKHDLDDFLRWSSGGSTGG